jgi:signal transduction histidine kinase
METWLERMYERHGARYLWGAGLAVYALLIVTLVPVASWPPARYEGLSFARFAEVMGIALSISPVLVLMGYLWSRESVRAVAAWHAGDRSERRAAEVRTAAFEQPRRLILRIAMVSNPLFTPIAVLLLALPSHHTTAVDVAELAVAFQAESALLLLTGYVLLEVAWRPVRASITPLQMATRGSGRLANRLVGPVLSLVLMSCVYVGALFSSHRSAGAGGLFVIVGVALAITAFWALVLLPMLSITVLKPIRDLIAGHRAVARGALRADVPVTTDDEFGELAASFNQMTADLRRHTEELRTSRQRIVAAADGERRRIERNLHDGAQQHLVLMNLKLGLLERMLISDPATATGIVADLRRDLGAALSELRDLARGLYPQLLESEGLAGALREAGASAAIPTTVDCDGAGRYSRELEAAVYFCCLEALQNAGKHAGAGSHATVTLSRQNGELQFEVADDGRGFDPGATEANSGLQNMTDRIGAVGGRLSVRSAPGAGTTVSGRIPVT